jgi:glycine/D-amino acid oxidase-like deaminating enzyme
MEHEQIEDKHVFHNYGHGSAGVALAPGSAHLTVKSLNIFYDITKHIEVAVLGAGITGLFTAI